MLKFMIPIFFLGFFQQLQAHPTTMGSISGEHISLQTIGHSFAGSIKDRIILGRKLPGQFISEIKIVDHDHESVSYFKSNNNNVFGGEINIRTADTSKTMQIEFVELVKEENRYTLKFDGKLTNVIVTADDFSDGHFINPEYTMEYKGEVHQFKLNGQACYGYSLHLIAMIMGALII
ncbi:MAG: hypothetical protein AB8G05_04210 [Oligoflexales bacterium]